MQIKTTRFGLVEIEPEDVISFPAGLIGFERCRRWVLLADAENEVLAWLQSTTDPRVAMAVVSPRRFVPGYQVRVYRSELGPLGLPAVGQAQVLVIVGKNERGITLNLKAPLVIHVERRLGRQVVINTEESAEYELAKAAAPLKRSA